MYNVVLLLGSNLGDKKKFLDEAESKIAETIGNITKKSSVYNTEPWGFKHHEYFYNRILIIDTEYTALQVLSSCLTIEKQLGRKRKKGNYEARTIDIDLIFYGNEIIRCNDLTIPHPQMHLRRFVLEPLCEVAPDMIHPLLYRSVVQLLAECTDVSNVERLI